MSDFNHCRQCGRRLRDVIFCPRCGECLCSGHCLNAHASGHRESMATAADRAESPADDLPLRAGEPEVAKRSPPVGSSEPGSH
jgi:hypothetical protein